VSDSPIEQVLQAVDKLDLEGAVELFAEDAQFSIVDGRRAEGTEQIRALLSDYLSKLRSTSHRITRQWHVDDFWIAEVESDYEMRDYLQINDLPRAWIVRHGSGGLAEIHVYGAHETPLDQHRTGNEGMWIGGRWVPPL
jgi:SnoaL-like protein